VESEPVSHAQVSIAAGVPLEIPVLSSSPVMEDVLATEAASEPAAEAGLAPELPPAVPVEEEESYEWIGRIGLELLAPRQKPRPGWYLQLALGTAGGLVLLGGLFYSGILQRYFEPSASAPTSTLVSNLPSTGGELRSRDRLATKPADSASLVELGRQYARRQDWIRAEAAYRAVLDSSPGNREAATGLSDVLYQEQKYEESAAVLNRLASINSQN